MKIITYLSISILLIYECALGQWTHIGFSDKYLSALFAKDNELFVGQMDIIYRSFDDGLNFDTVATLNTFEVSSFNRTGNTLFAVTSWLSIWPIPNACIFRSSDGGATWDSVFAGPYGATSIQSINEHIYSNVNGGLYHSPDNGNTWVRIDTTSIFTDFVDCIATSDSNMYISLGLGGLYLSQDFGKTWISIKNGLPNAFYNLVTNESTVFVKAGDNNVYCSNNLGQNWKLLNRGLPESAWIINLTLIDDYLFATDGRNFHSKVYIMNLADSVWSDFSTGLNLGFLGWINSYASTGEFVFAASDSGLWRRPLSQLVSVKNKDSDIFTKKFDLYQNYPNPFNPETTISFYLPKTEFITLKVFDMIGREIVNLVHQRMLPGNHKIKFDATGLSSGIYFYKLQTGNYSESKKMIFMY